MLSFSAKQQACFAGWKRPAELFGLPNQGGGVDADGPSGRLMTFNDDSDLVQDITTDCSVVASLCAVMKHLGPRNGSLLSSLMFPYDHSSGRPMLSENGKYIFRMNFNGCPRQVTIDDCLPSSSSDRTLFVVDRRNPCLIWPALLEKAYLKVRGGYDFPGSNSGTDLYVLTGWIPEQIFLQTDDLEFDHTWDRIQSAYDHGDVVITLGTGRLSKAEEEAIGLAGEHDYAVLGLEISNKIRRLLLKNPWCDGLVWKGVGSSYVSAEPSVYPPTAPGLAAQPASLSRAESMTGAFWITFEDVVQNFESLYLNWNPGLFTDVQDHHFTWENPSHSSSISLAHNPQYSLRSASGGTVWILLNRHFADDELAIAKNRIKPDPDPTLPKQLGFMSLYIFGGVGGTRVQLGDRALHRGPFVDSPQTLARFDAQPGVTYTIAAAQQDLPLAKYAFTLTLLSRGPLAVSAAPDPLPHWIEVDGSWTRRTAGGNAEMPTYFANPQFSISLSRASPLSLLLTADDPDVPVHVDLVWAKGQRVTALSVRDLVCSSGEYRRGCALAEVHGGNTSSSGSGSGPGNSAVVDAGTYTAVLSTFEPGQLARFTLRVGSGVPAAVRPVLADAAGRLRTTLPRVVPYPDAKRVRLSAPRLTRASAVARVGAGTGAGSGMAFPSAGAGAAGRSPCAIRVSLERGQGPDRELLVVSGEGDFRDAAMGLRTPEFDVDPVRSARPGLWLVIEQMGSSQQSVDVEILSDGTVHSGAWEGVDD